MSTVSPKYREAKAELERLKKLNQSLRDQLAAMFDESPMMPIVKEIQCIACEGVPARPCDICGEGVCADCRADHNHGEGDPI